MCKNPLKNFRTMTGETRRAACRADLVSGHNINFAAQDPHALTASQLAALSAMAKAVSWRKSAASSLSVGMAFYVYLARDAKQSGHVAQSASAPPPRRPFNYGRATVAA